MRGGAGGSAPGRTTSCVRCMRVTPSGKRWPPPYGTFLYIKCMRVRRAQCAQVACWQGGHATTAVLHACTSWSGCGEQIWARRDLRCCKLHVDVERGWKAARTVLRLQTTAVLTTARYKSTKVLLLTSTIAQF